MPIAPAAPFNVTSQQREELVAMARSTVLSHAVWFKRRRCCWLLTALRMRPTPANAPPPLDTVRRWRRRFETEGVNGIGKTAAGRGRKPSITGSGDRQP